MAKRYYGFDLNNTSVVDLGEHENSRQADAALKTQGGQGWVGTVSDWRSFEEDGMILRDDRPGKGQGYLATVSAEGAISVNPVKPEDEPFSFGGPMFGGEGQFRNGKITRKS